MFSLLLLSLSSGTMLLLCTIQGRYCTDRHEHWRLNKLVSSWQMGVVLTPHVHIYPIPLQQTLSERQLKLVSITKEIATFKKQKNIVKFNLVGQPSAPQLCIDIKASWSKCSFSALSFTKYLQSCSRPAGSWHPGCQAWPTHSAQTRRLQVVWKRSKFRQVSGGLV